MNSYTQGDTQVTQNLGCVSTREGRLLAFPNILQHCVSQDLDRCHSLITMDEAKRYRLELMEERKGKSLKRNDRFETDGFN